MQPDCAGSAAAGRRMPRTDDTTYKAKHGPSAPQKAIEQREEWPTRAERLGSITLLPGEGGQGFLQGRHREVPGDDAPTQRALQQDEP